MVLTAIVAAALIHVQQHPQNKTRLGLDYDFPYVQFVGKSFFGTEETVTFIVKVQDVDVDLYRYSESEEWKAQVSYSGGNHQIRIDDDYKAHSSGDPVKSVVITQGQIATKNLGWDESKKWFSYEVAVTLPKEQRVAGANFWIPIEVRDACPAPWERDRSQFCSYAFGFVE